MLKNGPKFGKDYFDELLVKIKASKAGKNYISDFDELLIESKKINKNL